MILIDHNCIDLTEIPDNWTESAKDGIKLHYAHTSHGGQLIIGIQMLKESDPKYNFARGEQALPNAQGALCIFDGQEDKTYITPGDYWNSPEGVAATQAVLDNNKGINVSM